jgi:hypothetical protein
MINSRNTLGTARLNGLRAAVLGLVMALIAVALMVRGTRGQETAAEPTSFDVVGRVVDAETGTELVGAWVGLTGTDWGSLTDERGRFRIPDVAPGPLELTVEQLAYEPLVWRGTVADDDEQLTIGLEARPILLEGLRVVTDRFRSRRNAAATSVFAYDRADLATSTARDALEFIEFRSAVWSTPCNGRRGDRCLFVRGRLVEPVVYVDEMPLLGGLAYLETLRPWELQMIEVYGGGRHIRAYTPAFMERAARTGLAPLALTF